MAFINACIPCGKRMVHEVKPKEIAVIFLLLSQFEK